LFYYFDLIFLNLSARDDGDNQLFKQRVERNTYPRDESMHKIDTLFKVPQCIWEKLYRYFRVLYFSIKYLNLYKAFTAIKEEI